VVIVPDDSIERRWGPHIRDRGIYRDPVRSSRGFFVKTSGRHWLSLAVVLPIPWAKRRWALPFLTILAPSQRANAERGRRHKPLTRWAIQAILQTRRWLPERAITIVGDSSFAGLGLIAAMRRHVGLITRLRLDANLFAPAELTHKASLILARRSWFNEKWSAWSLQRFAFDKWITCRLVS